MAYTAAIGAVTHHFADLRTLLAKATPLRSGDELAGVAAGSAEERIAKVGARLRLDARRPRVSYLGPASSRASLQPYIWPESVTSIFAEDIGGRRSAFKGMTTASMSMVMPV